MGEPTRQNWTLSIESRFVSKVVLVWMLDGLSSEEGALCTFIGCCTKMFQNSWILDRTGVVLEQPGTTLGYR